MQRWVGMKQEPQGNVVGVSEKAIGGRVVLFLSTISFIVGTMFLSQNITGNIVANFSTNGANWFGAMLFVLAIMGFSYYIWNRKNQQRRKKIVFY